MSESRPFQNNGCLVPTQYDRYGLLGNAWVTGKRRTRSMVEMDRNGTIKGVIGANCCYERVQRVERCLQQQGHQTRWCWVAFRALLMSLDAEWLHERLQGA